MRSRAASTEDAAPTGEEESDLTDRSFIYRCTATGPAKDARWIKVSKMKVVYHGAQDFKKADGAARRELPREGCPARPVRLRHSGDLGGFAILGIRGDWYSSTDYVCFRK